MTTKHTPGPWEWFGNARNREIYLATTHSGRRYVMGFRRWGMKNAQPMFQPANRGLVPAEQLLTFEVGDRAVRGLEQAKADDSVYRLDISGIDCPDAHLIKAAPDLLEALEPFVVTKSGDEFTTITVRSTAIDNARKALAKAQRQGDLFIPPA